MLRPIRDHLGYFLTALVTSSVTGCFWPSSISERMLGRRRWTARPSSVTGCWVDITLCNEVTVTLTFLNSLITLCPEENNVPMNWRENLTQIIWIYIIIVIFKLFAVFIIIYFFLLSFFKASEVHGILPSALSALSASVLTSTSHRPGVIGLIGTRWQRAGKRRINLVSQEPSSPDSPSSHSCTSSLRSLHQLELSHHSPGF